MAGGDSQGLALHSLLTISFWVPAQMWGGHPGGLTPMDSEQLKSSYPALEAQLTCVLPPKRNKGGCRRGLGSFVLLIGVRDKTYLLWAQGPAGLWTFWVEVSSLKPGPALPRQAGGDGCLACLSSLSGKVRIPLLTPCKEQACFLLCIYLSLMCVLSHMHLHTLSVTSLLTIPSLPFLSLRTSSLRYASNLSFLAILSLLYG